MPSRSATSCRGPRRRSLRSTARAASPAGPGAIVGGAGFILPGLAVILGLAALFLSGSAPEWARALGAGGGAAVAAVAVRAGVDLMRPSWRAAEARRARWAAYVCAGAPGRGSRRAVARGRPPRVRHRRARRPPWARRLRRAGDARGGAVGGRLGGAGLDGVQGRRPELRRRVRDHPADAGRRGLALPLDDVGPVPRGGRARPDHAGARRPDGGGGRIRGVRCRGRARRGSDRLQPVVRPRPPRTAAVRPDPHGRRARGRSSRAPGRRRSERSSAPPSRSRAR